VAAPRDIVGIGALGAALLSAQTRAYDRVEAALRSRRFSQLTLETAAWIETGAWTRNGDAAATGLRQRPTRPGAEILAEHHGKIIRRGRKLAELSPDARHKVRIQAKKLRYAGDFFAALYRGKAAGG